jgi:hypothetical protein
LLESDGVLEAVHCTDAEVEASHHILAWTNNNKNRFEMPASFNRI